jgi:hypothetical protein
MFILYLNNMRDCKIEMLQPVAWAETKEQLLQFLEAQKVEPYSDREMEETYGTTWSKTFRKGGPLEWHNPPYDAEIHFRRIPTHEEVIESLEREKTYIMNNYRKVS